MESSSPALVELLKGNGVINSGGCIAQLSSGIAHSALQLGLLARHLDGCVRPGLAARCAALQAALQQHLPPGCSVLCNPAGGYFLWVSLPAQVRARGEGGRERGAGGRGERGRAVSCVLAMGKIL